MDCPACEKTLTEKKVADIVVDVCENGCGGIWFDNYELEKVDEEKETAGEALLDIPFDPAVNVDYKKPRPCPRCEHKSMIKHFASVQEKVEVDECPACGGVWLDYGELGLIRSQYATEDERGEAAKAYFSKLFDPKLEAMHRKSEQDLKRARKFARMFRFICPSYYIPGKQHWGAF